MNTVKKLPNETKIIRFLDAEGLTHSVGLRGISPTVKFGCVENYRELESSQQKWIGDIDEQTLQHTINSHICKNVSCDADLTFVSSWSVLPNSGNFEKDSVDLGNLYHEMCRNNYKMIWDPYRMECMFEREKYPFAIVSTVGEMFSIIESIKNRDKSVFSSLVEPHNKVMYWDGKDKLPEQYEGDPIGNKINDTTLVYCKNGALAVQDEYRFALRLRSDLRTNNEPLKRLNAKYNKKVSLIFDIADCSYIDQILMFDEKTYDIDAYEQEKVSPKANIFSTSSISVDKMVIPVKKVKMLEKNIKKYDLQSIAQQKTEKTLDCSDVP